MVINKLINLTVHHLKLRYIMFNGKGRSNKPRSISLLEPTASNMKAFGDYLINQCYSLMLLNFWMLSTNTTKKLVCVAQAPHPNCLLPPWETLVWWLMVGEWDLMPAGWFRGVAGSKSGRWKGMHCMILTADDFISWRLKLYGQLSSTADASALVAIIYNNVKLNGAITKF